MSFDAVSAGVSLGGLISSSEIKVLICYILKSVKEPVPAAKLCELLNYEGIANAFEVSDNIEDLLQKNHIMCVDENETSYTTTPSGNNIADSLKSSVPTTVREKACKAVLKMLSRIRNTRETDIAVTREGGNTFITCSALENNEIVMSVKLLVTDENQAVAIKNKFLDDPSEIYSKIVDLFTE